MPLSPGTFESTPPGLSSILQQSFVGLSSLPSTVWSYAGTPGGVSSSVCNWNASQLQFGANGLQIITQWGKLPVGTYGWLSGGVGTHLSVDGSSGSPGTVRFRVQEQFVDGNILGLNHIDLAWPSGNVWPHDVEIDGMEAQNDSGLFRPTSRIHYDTYFSTVQTSGGAAGTNTVTVTTPPSVNDPVMDVTHPSYLPSSTYVTGVNGHVVTLSNKWTTSCGSGDTLMFTTASNLTTTPISWPAMDNGWHWNEFGLVYNSGDGSLTFSVYQDNVQVGSSVTVPADAQIPLSSVTHWLGMQSQMYSIGSSPPTATSVRNIAAFEILSSVVRRID